MDEDLLVLLVPGVEGRPFEADRVVEARDLGRAEHPRRLGVVDVAELDAEDLDVAALGLLGRALVDEHFGADVGERDVVLRKAGPLPDVAGLRGVDDRLPGEHGTDAPGHRLDVVRLHEGGGIVGHVAASGSIKSALNRRTLPEGPLS